MEDELIAYAKRFINTPYIYAANGAGAMDCSALICETLKAFGFLDPGKDFSSQMIHDHLEFIAKSSGIKKAAILFFGENKKKITHTSMAINEWQMIEAGGGDSTTVNMAESKRRGAMVRVRPINARRDLVAALNLI